jgi:hypothetical protein
LNPWILGPMESMITITPPRITVCEEKEGGFWQARYTVSVCSC